MLAVSSEEGSLAHHSAMSPEGHGSRAGRLPLQGLQEAIAGGKLESSPQFPYPGTPKQKNAPHSYGRGGGLGGREVSGWSVATSDLQKERLREAGGGGQRMKEVGGGVGPKDVGAGVLREVLLPGQALLPRKAAGTSSAVKRELDIMQAQLKLTCQEITMLRKTVASKDEQFERLRAKSKTAVSKALTEADEEKVREKSTKALLQQQNAALQLEVADLSKAIAGMTREVQQLREDKQQLNAALRSQDEQVAQLVRAKEAELTAAAAMELACVRELAHKAQAECQDIRKVADELADELIEVTAASEHKESSVAAQQRRQAEKMREELAGLEQCKQQLEESKQQVQQLQERLMLSEQRSELAASQLEVAQLDGRTMLARFAQERRQVSEALEEAQQHVLDLSRRNAEVTSQFDALFQKTCGQVEQTLAEVRLEAQQAAVRAEARYQRMSERLKSRDAEVAHVRQAWRCLLVAHPDLDLASETAVEDCRALRTDNAQLVRQNEALRADNEELVVAIAVQHLRLLLARWRQPLCRERFKMQLQAATESVCIEDEEEAGTEVEDERRGASGQENRGGTMQEAAKSPPLNAFSKTSPRPGQISGGRESEGAHNGKDESKVDILLASNAVKGGVGVSMSAASKACQQQEKRTVKESLESNAAKGGVGDAGQGGSRVWSIRDAGGGQVGRSQETSTETSGPAGSVGIPVGRGAGGDELGGGRKRCAGEVVFEDQVSGVSMSADSKEAGKGASKACQQPVKRCAGDVVFEDQVSGDYRKKQALQFGREKYQVYETDQPGKHKVFSRILGGDHDPLNMTQSPLPPPDIERGADAWDEAA